MDNLMEFKDKLGDSEKEYEVKFFIKRIENLKSSYFDKIDPYVRIRYGKKIQKTKAIDNEENPKFN